MHAEKPENKTLHLSYTITECDDENTIQFCPCATKLVCVVNEWKRQNF